MFDIKIDMKDLERDFGSLTAMCRELVERGADPGVTIEVFRDDVVCLRTSDIYETAKWEVDGDHFRKYRPNKYGRRGSTCV